ncbi:50S ribosomal protein L24e, partial [Candidatus Micrarchaeota archaeon]|nr:50S ribosomal protein L24e [Candidatus Micrarchaeota archaeon]
MDKGSGKIFVKKEGNIFSFCSKKCEKNLLKLKRNPRNVKWTQESRKQKQL